MIAFWKPPTKAVTMAPQKAHPDPLTSFLGPLNLLKWAP